MSDSFLRPADRDVILILPGERPPSWNDSYAGQHWTKRQAVIERLRMAVRAALDPEQVELFTDPVDVTITVYFDRQPLDADNIPAKLYIDALKGWVLKDDDGRFVRSVRTIAEVDREEPRVAIVVSPRFNGSTYAAREMVTDGD